MNATTTSVGAQVAVLPSLPTPELWALWDRYFPRRPENPNRAFLESRVAYKLQEQALRNWEAATGVKQSRSKLNNLLCGLIFDPDGEPMYPTNTLENGKFHPYYISKSNKMLDAEHTPSQRVSACAIEATVVKMIKRRLNKMQTATLAFFKFMEMHAIEIDQDEIALKFFFERLCKAWHKLFPIERVRIVKLMIERVDLLTGCGLEVKWRAPELKVLRDECATLVIAAQLFDVQPSVCADSLLSFVPLPPRLRTQRKATCHVKPE